MSEEDHASETHIDEEIDEEKRDPEKTPSGHWQLFRDVIVFQVKLAADGLRDLLLSPVSIVSALVGMVLAPADPQKYFRRLMQFGHKTDRMINLFDSRSSSDDGPKPFADAYVQKLEHLLVDAYKKGALKKGGVAGSVKDGTDDLIARLHARQRSAGRSADRSADRGADRSAGPEPAPGSEPPFLP